MEELIIKRINKKLQRINEHLSFDDYLDNEQKYLYQIEIAIRDIVNKKTELWKAYRKLKINQVSISKKSSMSRPTINKYAILNKYIELSTKDNNKDDVENIIENLQVKIKYQDKMISNLVLRDVLIEENNIRINEMENVVKNLKLENENYMSQTIELESEVKKLRSELSKYKLREVDFGGHDK